MAKKLKTNNQNITDVNPNQQSPEDLKKRREEITEFYKDNIPHLKAQAKYEGLLAEIEESRARRMQAQLFMSQQMAEKKPANTNSAEAKAFKQAMEEAASKIEE